MQQINRYSTVIPLAKKMYVIIFSFVYCLSCNDLTHFQAKWATETRSEIATYLQQGPEGKFYYRMVDTVLSRDKNWAHWKAEGCPLIERTSVSAEEAVDAKTGAQKACATKKIRATPLGSLDLQFLSDGDNAGGLEKLKHPDRYVKFQTGSQHG